DGETTATASTLSAGINTITINDAVCGSVSYTVSIGAPAALGGSISNPLNPTCNGYSNGAATAAGNGGTSPYTYLWSDGETTATATGLAAGTSSVQINDANHCGPVTYTVTLAAPTALSATISGQTNPTCHTNSNGIATANVSGGTSPYTYSWSDGETTATATGLPGGSSTVQINDANHCGPVTYTVTLTSPSAVTATITGESDVTCNGGNNGSATVTAGGGNGHQQATYTYSWAPTGGTFPTASGLSAGTYTVTVMDRNHCVATATVVINQPSALTANIGTVNNVTCNGGGNGSATVNVGGGTTPYSYSWSPTGGNGATANNLTAGVYTVTVSDLHSCGPVTATVNLTQPTAVSATISGQTSPTCFGYNNGIAIATGNGGTSPYTYSWSDGETTATATTLPAGNNTVLVTDVFECTSVTYTVNLTSPTVLSGNIYGQVNPTCFGVNNGIASANGNGGTSPYTYTWSDGETTETATTLPTGVSSVQINDANNCGPVTYTLSLTAPTQLVCSISGQTNLTCFGVNTGSATANVSGGTTPYSYSWSDGETTATATTLPAGNNTIQVSDANHCGPLTFTVTLTSPTALSGTIYGQTNLTCFGVNTGSATANGIGGTTPYTYSWSDGETTETASSLPAGVSSVEINDANHCGPVTYTLSLTAPTQLVCSISGQSNLTCFGVNTGSATANVSGGTTPYTYSWSDGETTATASTLPAGNNTVQVNDANHCGPLTFTVTLTSPTALTGNIYGQVNPTCFSVNNGIASVNGNGGTSPYTYTWSDGETTETASSLPAGVSSVQINDANHCGPVTYTVSLTAPPALTGGISNPINPTCNSYTNGGATANVSGGTTPYTYSWSDGETTAVATGLGGGISSVQINDANHCGPLTYTVSLTAPPAIVINSTSSTPSSGSNGTASVNASGGTGALTYSWSPSGETDATATGLNPGTYTISVMDANECGPVTATVNVRSTGGCNAPVIPTICYVSVDTSVNNNVVYWDTTGLATANIETFNVYRKETSGYTLIGSVPSNAPFIGDFSFSDNTSNTDKESYFYELTSVNYCSDESEASPYHQTMLLQANLGVGNVVNLDWNEYVGNMVNYYVVLRDTGTGFMRYDSVPSGSSAYTDLTPTLSKPTLAYMVNAVWTLACSPSTMSHSNKKYINVTGINQLISSSSIEVYPNPVRDEVSVAIKANVDGILTITDVLGQQVYSEKVVSTGNTVKQISMNNLSQGVYMLKITSNGKEIVKRIVKQ
ncbi:MAG TPA: T9SS type A sorting domain-containing protein, partial [Bacteroidia bacterium]|nr:T9SS type A sorting domain-containing protein [Bacteroidia bacterium]